MRIKVIAALLTCCPTIIMHTTNSLWTNTFILFDLAHTYHHRSAQQLPAKHAIECTVRVVNGREENERCTVLLVDSRTDDHAELIKLLHQQVLTRLLGQVPQPQYMGQRYYRERNI